MFWGLVLDPGKRYTTTVDKSFHVSMAALDCSSVKNDSEILSVILECDGQENILCNLSKQQRLLQSHLDLNFMTGDKVCFEVKGNGKIHLSGYLVPEDEDDFVNPYANEDSDEEEEEEDEEEEQEETPTKNDKQKGKRKLDTSIKGISKKKAKLAEESDEDSDDDEEEDDIMNTSPGSEVTADSDDEEDEDDSDEDEEESDEDGDEMFEESDDDEEEEEDDEPAVPIKEQQKTPQSNKKQQNNKQTPKQQQQQQSGKKQTPGGNTPLVNGSGPNQQQSGKKNKNKGQETPKGQNPQTPNQNSLKAKNQKTPSTNDNASPQQNKKVLDGGVTIKDIREGNGPVAKHGQMVSVYYQGRLRSNNKMFDECKKNGPPFKFRLGKGEVIKGWDVGVSGMKVGGLRTITCPPNAAYGQKGSPPQIPPNSALTFQVELKAVN